jgi:hypothetical protein
VPNAAATNRSAVEGSKATPTDKKVSSEMQNIRATQPHKPTRIAPPAGLAVWRYAKTSPIAGRQDNQAMLRRAARGSLSQAVCSRELLPASFKKVTDKDVSKVAAYVKTPTATSSPSAAAASSALCRVRSSRFMLKDYRHP